MGKIIGPKQQLWVYLPSSTQTFEGSAKAYETNFHNNLWMHASKRLKTVIKSELDQHFERNNVCRSYLANVLYRKIVGAQFVTDIKQYKNTEQILAHAVPFLERQDMKDLVTVHQQWLHDAFTFETKPEQLLPRHYMDGVLSENNIKFRPYLFLAYQLYLAQRLDELRPSKATFQIIPQMTMKRRCVTFGKNELTDLLYNLPDNGGFIDEVDVRGVRAAERMARAAKKKPQDVEMVKTRKRKQPSPPTTEKVKPPTTRDQILALWMKTYSKVFICSNKKWTDSSVY
jgi:hypothetical protein